MTPPTAAAVVSSPKPDRVHAQPLAGVEDEHRPRRPERDVEREDRQRERPHRRMGDEPADALAPSRPEADPLARLAPGARWRRARRATRRARSRRHSSRTGGPCRRRTGTRRSAAPRAGSSAGTRPASGRWRCRGPRAPRGPAGACCSPSRRRSRRCPGRTARPGPTAMLTSPVTIVATSTASTTARTRLTTTTIRRRSNRSAAVPAHDAEQQRPAGTRSAAPSRRGTGRASATRRAADRRRARCRRRRC